MALSIDIQMSKKHENILSHFSNREIGEKTSKRYYNISPRFIRMKGSNDIVLVMMWSNTNSLKKLILYINYFILFVIIN